MANSKVTIRKAKPTDATIAQEIVFLILRSYGIEPDAAGLDANVVTFGDNEQSGVRDFVGEVDGQVVGVMAIYVGDIAQLKLTDLYVSPKARGQGLGRKLLEHAVDVVRQLKGQRITLETRTSFKEAVRLYESAGWQRGPDLPEGYGPDRIYYFDVT